MRHKRNIKTALIFPVTIGIIGLVGNWGAGAMLIKCTVAWGVGFLITSFIDFFNGDDKGVKKGDLILSRTCFACPEQYDCYYKRKQVGYLRLRHGIFTVDYPDVEGEEIYSACPDGDGIFNDNEREFYLNEAKESIIKKLKS